MPKKPSPPDPDEVADLVNWALEETGLSQYALAQRMAEIRGTRLASQDQALRRIRRLGQLPTLEIARDIAEALRPELDLPDDFFYRPRSQATQIREATLAALQQIESLQERVEALEKALKKNGGSVRARKGK